MGVTQAAGLSLRWFRDTFGTVEGRGGDPYELLTQEASVIPPGADGVIWAPYLMGERTPYVDSEVRAALVGLSASHRRGHIIRAILEGVAFSLKDSLTIFAEIGVPVDDIRLGGSRPTFTEYLSRNLQQNRALHMVRQSWPALVRASGPR
jgi:xylulokinase